MKVIISTEAVNAALDEQQAWKLHKLLIYAIEERHNIIIPPTERLIEWIDSLDIGTSKHYKTAIEQSARAATTLAAQAATVIITPTHTPRWASPNATLNLDDALMLLEEPFGVLVENSKNDWHFLCGIMSQRQRARVQYLVHKNFVLPLHGGGTSLLEKLESRLTQNTKRLRTFVLFDSDRLHPEELAEGWTPERLGGRPVACHAFEWEKIARERLPNQYWMLKRRFIESYIPKEEFPKITTPTFNSQTIEAFFRMNRDAQWYFNIKKGFQGDSKRDDKERCRDLYQEVSNADRDALQNGFGEKVANHYVNATNYEFNWDPEAREEAAMALEKLMCLI